MTEKPETRTTFLAAVPAPWSDVAGTYDLDFGKFHAPPAVTKRLLQHSRRNLLDDAINAAGEIKDGVVDAAQAVGDQFAKIGDFDIQKSITFDIGVGKAGQKTNIFTDPKEYVVPISSIRIVVSVLVANMETPGARPASKSIA